MSPKTTAEPVAKTVRLILTKPEHTRFRVLAAEKDMSMTEALTEVVRDYIERH
jgi:hypothetical protein